MCCMLSFQIVLGKLWQNVSVLLFIVSSAFRVGDRNKHSKNLLTLLFSLNVRSCGVINGQHFKWFCDIHIRFNRASSVICKRPMSK